MGDFEEYQARKNLEMTTSVEAARVALKSQEDTAEQLLDKVKKMEQELFETDLKVTEIEAKKKIQVKILNAKVHCFFFLSFFLFPSY